MNTNTVTELRATCYAKGARIIIFPQSFSKPSRRYEDPQIAVTVELTADNADVGTALLKGLDSIKATPSRKPDDLDGAISAVTKEKSFLTFLKKSQFCLVRKMPDAFSFMTGRRERQSFQLDVEHTLPLNVSESELGGALKNSLSTYPPG